MNLQSIANAVFQFLIPLTKSPARKIVLVLAVGWLTLPASAIERDWIGGLPNDVWSDPDNWDPTGVPQDGDALTFDANGFPIPQSGLMVNDLTNLTVQQLAFPSGSWQLSGNELGVRSAIGNSGDGLVEINCAIRLEGGARFSGFSTLPSDSSDLRVTGPINLNGRLLTLLARSDATVDIAGPISGNGNIRIIVETVDYFPSGTVKFSGTEANTFTGPVTLFSQSSPLFPTVAGSHLVLDKQSAIAVPGALTLGTNCSVKLNRPHQIADAAAVSLGAGAYFVLDGNTETIGSLNMVGSWTGVTRGRSVVETGGATLSVQGNITASNFYSNNVPTIEGKLGLPPGNHTITVGGNQFYGLDIRAQILGDGGFTKTGTAGLLLSSSNTFNGELAVSQGILTAAHGNAFGSVAGFSYLSNSATLLLQNAAVYGESLFVRGDLSLGPDASGSWLEAAGTNVWSGPIILDTNLIVTGFNGGAVNFNGLISGAGGLRCLSGTVELSGTDANTFTDSTVVQNPLLLLNKSAGLAAFGGPLVVGGGSDPSCEVRWLQNYQRLYANVTLFNNALVNLNNRSDDFGPVTFNGGAISTGTGELGVYGLVSVNFEQHGTIDGRIGLPSGYREFHVEFNPTTSAGLHINAAVVGPGHLRKTGLGRLWLNGVNTYTGLSVVDEGTLIVTAPAGLGSSNGDTIVNDGGTLRFSPGLTTILVPERISIRGTGTAGDGALEVYGNTILRNQFPSIFACLDLTTNATVLVESGAKLTADGFISGIGPLTKTGPGALVFSNANANTYSGETIISEGTLELRKPNGAISVPGNLVLGPAAAISPAIARLFQTGGLNANAIVTANANSLLDLNGNSHTLARLNLYDGGSAQTGAGRLNFPGGGVVQVGSLSPAGSHVSSSITGGIGLPPNNFITFNVAPFAIFPPFAAGPELDVPAIISVNGFENVNFEPAGFSKIALGRVRFSANNTYRGEAFISGGTLQVEGSQPESTARVGAGARLHGSGTIGHVNFLGSAGVIAPGVSPGILTTSNFNSGATGNGILQIELNGTTPGSGYDQVNVRGTVTLTGTTLNGLLNFPSATGNQFTIIENDGSDSVLGNFNGLPQNANLYLGGEQFTISYAGGNGNDVVLTRIATPPKPILTIEAVPPSLVRVLWPTNDPAFHLQFSTNLSSGNWAAATPSPVIIGTNYVVTNATSGTISSSVVTPIAWYRLGEDDPGAAPGLAAMNATDSAGTNHLEPFGGPLYTSAVSPDAATRVGSSLAVNFNGVDQFFSRSAVVSTAVNNFGIEAWVKPNTTAGVSTGIAYNGNGGNGWGLIQSGSEFSGTYGGVTVFVLGPVTIGTWAHLALVRDNGTTRLYYNGAAVGTSAAAPNPPTAGFEIGHRFQPVFNEYFNGAVDEVRVFTFAPGQFSTNDLLLNRDSTQTTAAPMKYYRLSKP